MMKKTNKQRINKHEHENEEKNENNNFLCTLCTVRMPNEFKCRSFHSKCKRNKKRTEQKFEPMTIQLCHWIALLTGAINKASLNQLGTIAPARWWNDRETKRKAHTEKEKKNYCNNDNGNGIERQVWWTTYTMHKWIVITCVCVCRLLRLSLNGLL